MSATMETKMAFTLPLLKLQDTMRIDMYVLRVDAHSNVYLACRLEQPVDGFPVKFFTSALLICLLSHQSVMV